MSGFWTAFITVLTAIIGVALVATLVSRNAQTPAVINSFWGGFSGALGAATAPVTGGNGYSSFGGNILPGLGVSAL